ncbi:MAG: transcriptional regulator [Hyphococcus sp.]|nr:MAG: transcriptional regulator [Marinicaulis sp.]
MDVLNDIIDTLGLKGALYFRTDFSPPFAIGVPHYEQAARFHLVVQGRCFVTLASGGVIELSAGDLILIPAGANHTLTSAPEDRAIPLETVIEDSGYSGTGVFSLGEGDSAASTQMVCGHFSFRAGADHPLLRALPEHLIVTNALRAKNPWLDDVLRLMVKQIFSDPDNSAATVTRLSEVIFIETLRASAEQAPNLEKTLSALKQRQIGDALLLMHERLDEPWTMEKLATAVGMSRSKFAESFRQSIGIAPMTYLTDWRIQKAISLLTASQKSVQQVAAETGYQSPAAFTRAFSQKMGVSPKEYRRQDVSTLH